MSIVFYMRTVGVVAKEFEKIEERMQHEKKLGIRPPQAPQRRIEILSQNFNRAKQRIIFQLIIINGVVLIFSAMGSYILSGQTLQPIAKAMKQQKQFISDAAHELKTPLTALQTSLEVNLMEKDISKQTKKILKENLKDVQNLTSLTQSLLTLASYEENAITLHEVNIHTILHRATELVEPLAQKKHITLTISKMPKRLSVRAHEDLLLQLVLIILDNAIKYTPQKGSIIITCVQKKKHIRVDIQDTGIGIAQQHLPYIFDRFYRVDNARTQSSSTGYGLGLSVAKKIVSQLNGDVSVTSEPEKGTIFSLTFQKI